MDEGMEQKEPEKIEECSSRQEIPEPAVVSRHDTADTAAHITGRPLSVLAVGGSSADLNALQRFFTGLPADDTLCILTILHPASSVDLLEAVSSASAMPVQMACHGSPLLGNMVYALPPDRNMVIAGGHLAEQTCTAQAVWRPLDCLFSSLATEMTERAIAVILSGPEQDGAEGIKAVRRAGGLVLVQDPSTALQPAMPRTAISTGTADMILPAEAMGDRIIHVARRTRDLALHTGQAAELDSLLRELFRIVRSRTGHDFSSYKTNTVLRRIERRMSVHGLLLLTDYLSLLRENLEEAQQLCKEFLIGVTSFFRDPEAFEVIRDVVIPRIFADRDPEDSVRIWHPCCATGEEVYSTAILIKEYQAEHHLDSKVLIFATDIDEAAITPARTGLYPETIETSVRPERLRKFFTKAGSYYQVAKQLREMIVFAHHNVIRDPPFSRLDLLVCRNFLIYLNTDMQLRLLNLFHQVLKPGAFLFCGSSETVDHHADQFTAVHKNWKIFSRNSEGTQRSAAPPLSFPLRVQPLGRPVRHTAAEEPDTARYVSKLLLERYSPPCVVVNEKFDVVHVSTRTTLFLELPVGEPTRDILKMAPADLRPALRASIHKAFTEQKQAAFRGVTVPGDCGTTKITIVAEPINHPGQTEKLVMVVFETIADQEQSLPSPTMARDCPAGDEFAKDALIRQLEEQLRVTHEQLLSTIGQLESSNEGLVSVNEELMSTNEEFQATNEELVTSREELQSLNEELVTVNTELHGKVEELNRVNSDLENFLICSDMATIFLDRSFNIMRFTPAICVIFNIIPADIGRPFRHLAGAINWGQFSADAESVLHDATPLERELTTLSANQCHIMRMLPYRTSHGEIDGIVVTFIDISERKRAEDALQQSETRYRNLVHYSPVSMFINRNGLIDWINPAAQRLFGAESPEELYGMTPFQLFHPDFHLIMRQRIAGLQEGKPAEMIVEKIIRLDGSERDVEVVAVPFTDALGPAILIMLIDITERMQTERERDITVTFLQLVNTCGNRNELIHAATAYIKETAACDTVGVRLRSGTRYPYQENYGTDDILQLLEQDLCAGGNEPGGSCLCGCIIQGHLSDKAPGITGQGTFFTNSVSRFLESCATDNSQALTDSTCNWRRYESVAMLPLRSGETRFGLLQLNDRRPNHFDTATIALWERLAGHLAVALEKFRVEEELEESDERWQFAIEGSNDGVWDRNVQTGVVYFSRQWKRMLGYENDEIGSSTTEWLKRVHAEDLPQVRMELGRHLSGETPLYATEYRMRCKNGTYKWILARGKVISRTEDGKPIRFVGTHCDITERKNLEEQLYQSQKMEAVGQLAGGIAHDFNNILTAIIGYSHLIAMNTGQLRQESPIRNYVEQIQSSAERAAELTQALLAFSRKQVMIPKVVGLNDTISTLEKMLRRLISENIDLQLTTCSEELYVLADKSKVEQMLINLATNAKDAMAGNGMLAIATKRMTMDDELIALQGFGKHGEYACITVSDTGCGIDEELQSKIFEPFFTTKEVGKGTGLGLSIVYGIVKQHGGYISVDSRPRKGTTFAICIPLVEKPADPPEARPAVVVSGGSETILLAEDDPAVRSFHKTLFSNAGYTVISAVDGEDALEQFDRYEHDIDLLVLDVVMPKLNGIKVYDRIRERRPDLKPLFLSGYTADILQEVGGGPRPEMILDKPVDPRTLLATLRSLLNGSADATRDS